MHQFFDLDHLLFTLGLPVLKDHVLSCVQQVIEHFLFAVSLYIILLGDSCLLTGYISSHIFHGGFSGPSHALALLQSLLVV